LGLCGLTHDMRRRGTVTDFAPFRWSVLPGSPGVTVTGCRWRSGLSGRFRGTC